MQAKNRLLKFTCMALLLGGLLAGCASGNASKETAASPGGSSVQSDAAAKKEDVTITMWMRWPEFADLNKQIIAKFEEKYPNIRVENTEVSSSNYLAQLQAAVTGEELPDVFAMHSSLKLYQLHELGAVHAINDVIGDRKNDFEPGMWSKGMSMMGDDIYAFPITTNHRDAYVMYSNLDVLKRAGLSEQDVPRSWDDLLKTGKLVEEKTGGQSYGVLFGMGESWFVNNLIAQMGSAISPEILPDSHMDPLTGKYLYESQGYVETIEYIKKLSDEKILHPNSLIIKGAEANQLFAGGEAAFLLAGLWEIPQFNKDGFQSYGVAPLPTKEGKQMYSEVTGSPKSALFVNQKTKHFEEVSLFLNFMMDEYYKGLVENGLNFSPIPAVNQSVTISDARIQQGLEIQDKQYIYTPHPFSKNLNTIQVYEAMSGKGPSETQASVLEGYLVGEITDVRAALQKISDQYNTVLSQTISDLQGKGVKVDPTDWIFENWKPFESYNPQ